STNFNTSTSAALIQTVDKADTTTTLVSSANPSVSGQSVTFTATVNPVAPGAGTRTGTVTFTLDSATTNVTVNASGQAALTTASLSVGSHTISAAYNGDGNFKGSITADITQIVS